MGDKYLEVRVAYVVHGRERVVEAIAIPVFGHSGMGDVVHEAFKEARQVLERAIMADNVTTSARTSSAEQT